MPRPIAILLAAGTGSRWDASGRESKLLAPAPRGRFLGEPLAVAAARNLLSVLPRVVAVVRPGDDPVRQRLRTGLAATGCDVIECAHASDGMGASLACGARAASELAAAALPGVLVALADMPAIDPATIDAVAREIMAGRATAAPQVHGRRGHPVGFGAHLLPRLASLRGDHGARELLREFPPHLVATDDEGALFDIDTRSDAHGPGNVDTHGDGGRNPR